MNFDAERALDADRIFRELGIAGEDWADKKSAYQALDDLTKTVYADIMTDFIPACPTKAEAEVRALADGKYKAHLASKSAARRAWLLAEVKYENLKTLSELRRSQESTRRAEMGLR